MTKRWDSQRTAARSGFKDGISKHRGGVFLKALKDVFDSWFVRNGQNGSMVNIYFCRWLTGEIEHSFLGFRKSCFRNTQIQ